MNAIKTILFFDVDNTIYSNAEGIVPDDTKRLLAELSRRDDVALGLATGRGNTKLSVIADVLKFFTYRVLINGAVVYKDDEIVYDQPIRITDIENFLKRMDRCVGMVGLEREAVNVYDERVASGMQEIRGHVPAVDPSFYRKNRVYQLWIFTDPETDLQTIHDEMSEFSLYPWHKGGVDFIYRHINKADGIKRALAGERDYRLICVGDGANDIRMIEMADIGIAMANSRFQELKEKADHIAPHVLEHRLFTFFKELGLI